MPQPTAPNHPISNHLTHDQINVQINAGNGQSNVGNGQSTQNQCGQWAINGQSTQNQCGRGKHLLVRYVGKCHKMVFIHDLSPASPLPNIGQTTNKHRRVAGIAAPIKQLDLARVRLIMLCGCARHDNPMPPPNDPTTTQPPHPMIPPPPHRCPRCPTQCVPNPMRDQTNAQSM